jgi:hypothetical protein
VRSRVGFALPLVCARERSTLDLERSLTLDSLKLELSRAYTLSNVNSLSNFNNLSLSRELPLQPLSNAQEAAHSGSGSSLVSVFLLVAPFFAYLSLVSRATAY